jgi:hypothetical protein
MNDDELARKLKERDAVVVHFSHHANMRGRGVFPVDMHEAIRNKDHWALSCSVLWPGYGMDPCGSVGVLFKPLVASVLSVSNKDSGSWTTHDGIDQSAGVFTIFFPKYSDQNGHEPPVFSQNLRTFHRSCEGLKPHQLGRLIAGQHLLRPRL